MDSLDSQDLRRQFLDLLHRHQGIVGKVSSAYASGSQEREDLAQEIIMQLWRAWPSFRGESSFATWAFRVALNTAMFQKRESARAGRVSLDERSRSVAAPNTTEPAETREAIQLLYGCIRELRELDRAIIMMHLEARPHAEIAEFTGLSTGTVAVRLHRIRHALRECLAAHGYTEE